MGTRRKLAAALVAALLPLAGCVAGKSQVNSYLFEDAQVGGDPGKSLKPVKNILVWPLENIAAGSKAKGIETPFTGLLIDTLTLRGGFDRVVILEEDQAKDLMTRAGEELGLKKKPKTPLDGALIATKLGQLSGTECILMGRLETYDEDKVDKATLTVVASSFNLLDAREKAYPSMDSFTAVKRIWRMNIKNTSQETPLAARKGMDDMARQMLNDIVDRLAADLGQGAVASGKALAQRVKELSAAAEKSLAAGEFDKATASWNEVLKLQPDNKGAKKGIEEVEKRKREAEERAKAAALKKQIDEIRVKALEAEKADNLEGALAEWQKVPELDKTNKEAADRIVSLEKKIVEKKRKEAEKIRGEALEAEKNGDLEAALAAWRKIPALDQSNKEAPDKIASLEKQIADKKKAEAERKAAAEKQAKEEAERKAKEEAETKAREQAEKKAKEEAQKKAREEAEKKAKEEAAAVEKAAAPAPSTESAPAGAASSAAPAAEPASDSAAASAPAPAAAPSAEAAAPKAPEPKAEAAPAAAPTPAATPAAAPPAPAAAPKASEPKAEATPVAAPAPSAPAPKGEAAPAAAPVVEPKAGGPSPAAAPTAGGGEVDALRSQAMDAFNKENYQASRDLWKTILEKAPEDKQAKEMLETTEMLLNALK